MKKKEREVVGAAGGRGLERDVWGVRQHRASHFSSLRETTKLTEPSFYFRVRIDLYMAIG